MIFRLLKSIFNPQVTVEELLQSLQENPSPRNRHKVIDTLMHLGEYELADTLLNHGIQELRSKVK